MMPAAFLLLFAFVVPPSTNGNTARPTLVEREFHIRAVDATSRELIAIGAVGSPTFRQLLDRLAASDLIVYIRIVDRLRAGVAGQLTFATTGGSYRFVRIELVQQGSSTDLVAALGHELQHAVEVADAPRVRDNQSLAMLYLHIGWSYDGSNRYESLAAQTAGERVRDEVISRR